MGRGAWSSLLESRSVILVTLISVGVLVGVGLQGAPAPPPESPLKIQGNAVPEASVCPALPAGVEEPATEPFALLPAEGVGQPCCVSLCEQICGAGEACACMRCQVLGCGL